MDGQISGLSCRCYFHLGAGQPSVLDFGPQPEPCCVATDASGNVYVAGSFATAASNGVLSAKIVVYKLDRANQVVYRFMFGGSSYDAPGGIAVDAKGNVFVVGSTS